MMSGSTVLPRTQVAVVATSKGRKRLAAAVAIITPASTGHRAVDQSEIRRPEEIPAAGQKMTVSGVIKKLLLNCAAKK
jgi:hypothetical protein